MNNLTSPEEITETKEIDIREEYRSPGENTVLKYVLYLENTAEGKSYSIQCIKYKNGVKVCQSTAPDVSSNEEFAYEMYQKIADGEVEPINLHEVVYDLLP